MGEFWCSGGHILRLFSLGHDAIEKYVSPPTSTNILELVIILEE